MAIKVQNREGRGHSAQSGLLPPRLDQPAIEMIDEVYKNEAEELAMRAMLANDLKPNYQEFRVGRNRVKKLVSFGDPAGRKYGEDGEIVSFGPSEVLPVYHRKDEDPDELREAGCVPLYKKDGKDGTRAQWMYKDMLLFARIADKSLRERNQAAMESWLTVSNSRKGLRPEGSAYASMDASGQEHAVQVIEA